MGIKHSKTSNIQTSGDPSLVGPADWNADHMAVGTVDLSTATTVIAPSGGIQGVSPLSFVGAPTGPCTSLQTAINTSTGDFYDCNGGVWNKVGPGAATLSSPVTTPSPLAFDVDLRLKGPNPYSDVTRYGVRSLVTNAIPAVAGITATITNGQPTATVSTSSCPSQTGSTCFVNGDGVVIYGAGTAHSMATPAAPMITPSLPNAAARTPLFVVNGPAGSTTYNYKIIARNKTGGLTAASPAGSTSTGAASLGAQSVNITSLSRAAGGNTVSVVTASAHGMSVGAAFRLSGTTSDGLFGGWYNVATAADNTHFTYVTGQWNYGTVSQTATGGSVAWFNCNHVTWTNVTGAFQYYIYSDRANPGTFSLVGVSFPVGVTTDNYTWDDYGSPFMDGIKLPSFVPTTAPASATSNNLVTTIASGAGTTTLTLAANAGTSVTNATILFDNAPNLVTAGTSNNFGPPLFFPAGGTYVINSFCDMTGSNNTFVQGGSLLLNETIGIISPLWFGDRLPSRSSGASFSWQPAASITVNSANPGIYVPSGNSSGFWGIQLNLSANAGLGILFDAGPNGISIIDSTFSSGGGVGDYAGIGLMFYGQEASGGAFGLYFSKVTLVSSQAVTTSVPMLFCRACGTAVFRSLSGGGRGLAFSGQPVSASGPFTFDGAFHYQAGNAPLIQSSAASTGQGNGSFYLQNITLDTMANPMFTSYTQGANGLRLTGGAGPAAGIPNITGAPASYITADWSAVTSGQNMNITRVDGTGISLVGTAAPTVPNPSGGIGIFGTAGLGYQFPTPAAPTVVVGVSGSCVSNCVPAGTYFYGIVANDINQGYSSESPTTSATTDGTQTITVSWVLLNGQVTTQRYRGTTATNTLSTDSRGTGVTGSSYVDAGNLSYSASGPGNTTGFSEGVSAAGFGGHAITLTQTLFTNLATPRNGTFYYCSDCTIANPCASGGNGAFAKRLNGIWVCN